ncbi:hypothetical protein [Granulicella aggregans]|uniref:hypothetical protein n=1 Tax=Granulicella aggregans TaxID=474949 RepID=UPI0021E066F0|nr:hypothetical protein [Granulicella aggregans]
MADNKKPAPAPKAAPAAKAPAPAAKPAVGATATHATGATTAGHTTGATTAGHTTGATTGGHTTTATAGGAKTTTTTGTKTTNNPAGAGGARSTTQPTTAGGRGPAGTPAPRTTGLAHTAGGPPPGHMPTGSHEVRTAHGDVIRTRPNGSRADVHVAGRNMDIHHGLNGNRRISVERADHSRVFAERGGRGYVQHPYRYGGREYGRRTYYDHGRYYDHYYGRHYYHGEYVDVYAPARFYSVGFYGWAYNPWAAPISYSWGWGAAPWYGYYGAYFTPYPVYPSAAFWLTDYLFSVSLQAAYAAAAANAEANAIAASNPPPPLSPDVKQMVADEVKSQLALENAEAAANAQNQASDPASSSIERMLSDGKPHVFIAGGDLDLVDANGQECPISQGDVIEVPSAPAPDATAATALVVASKGGKECARSTNVNVAFTDLQDMQNHLRETIDAGMGDLQAKQGKGGLPAAPPSATTPPVASAITAAAPPPDTNASAEIAEQSKAADQAEQEVASAAPVTPGPSDQTEVAAAPITRTGPPATIALGQTIDQVTGSFGQPLSVRDLGTKKVYVYKDMKVTFKAGKVTDIE